MTGPLLMPPATGINYSSWAMTGFVFQYWVRRHHFRVSVLFSIPFKLYSSVLQWWSRYNYILSAALDAGVAVGAIVIFFCLQYPNNGGFHLVWWGNTVHQNTLDGQGVVEWTLQSGQQGPFGLPTVRTPVRRSKLLLTLITVDLKASNLSKPPRSLRPQHGLLPLFPFFKRDIAMRLPWNLAYILPQLPSPDIFLRI